MPVDIRLLDQAQAACSARDWPTAEGLLLQFLHAQPNHPFAWQLLGEVRLGLGRQADAVTAFRQALQHQPTNADLLHRLAAAHAVLGHRDQAEATYRQLLRLRPEHAEALAALGVLLAEQGRLEEGIDLLRRAVQVRPDLAQAYNNLGVALANRGQTDEARACLERAVSLQPEYAEAHYNLGNVLSAQGKRPEAVTRYRRVLELRPDHGGAYNNLGLALNESGRPGEATVCLRQGVRLRPGAAEAHNNLGLALADLGHFAEAEACYHEALRLDPRHVQAHANLGNLYKEQGRTEEAMACYEVALWLDPQSASTRYNRSLALLQSGDWARGWKEYEWRWQRSKAPSRTFARPRWEGQALPQGTVLLWTEQGLGDTIQFVRFAAAVKERVGRVVLECPGLLRPLLQTCSALDAVVAEGEPLPPFDFQVPLLSLPGLLGITPETVPNQVPYLRPESARVARWRQRLAEVEGFRIGIVWQGNPYFQWDRHRSVPLRMFAALEAVPGVQLVSLQRVHGLEQLRGAGKRLPVHELGEDFDAEGPAFLDTAAVLPSLDLVVAVDTAVGHLAGALGVPVWLALSSVADWRWLTDREDPPWYPSMRLFRQRRFGDWREVFANLAEELFRHVSQDRSRGVRQRSADNRTE